MGKKLNKLQKELEELKRLVLPLTTTKLNEEWLDSADIKQLFHLSDSKLYRLRKTNAIPSTSIGKRFYYPKSFFNAALLQKIKNKPQLE
jgi:hypothetical protein